MRSPRAENKRANRPRRADYTKAFDKDWQRLTRSGRYNMTTLREVMLLLISNVGALPPAWRDHALTGDWASYRECHVGGDFLLIYKIMGETIEFVRCGTHADLFE